MNRFDRFCPATVEWNASTPLFLLHRSGEMIPLKKTLDDYCSPVASRQILWYTLWLAPYVPGAEEVKAYFVKNAMEVIKFIAEI